MRKSEIRSESRTSRGVPEWSGGEELYIGSQVSATGKVLGVTGIVPGPPGGATCPGGPRGLKVEGNQPLVGWGAPLGPPPAPRVGNPRGGGRPTWLGGEATPPFPPWPPPPLGIPSPRAGAPPGAYIKGGGRAATLQLWAPPSSPATPLPLASSAKPCRDPAAYTTTPSCC